MEMEIESEDFSWPDQVLLISKTIGNQWRGEKIFFGEAKYLNLSYW